MYRVFLAHPKSFDDAALRDLVEEATRAIAAKLSVPFEIVTARDDWEQRCAAVGGWNDWAASVASGTHSITFEPLFNAVLIPYRADGAVGKVTYQIALQAHAAGKAVRALRNGQVLAFDGFVPVAGGGNSWKAVARMDLPVTG